MMLNLKSSTVLVAFTLLLLVTVLVTPINADLPPRPTEPPPPTDMPRIRTLGGWIELRVQNAKSQWTLVQWQDSTGAWRDVDSWRGAFDSMTDGVGKKTWWVDQTSFGPTLYRWVVYDASNNQVLAQSVPFKLPIENKQTVTTEISLAP